MAGKGSESFTGEKSKCGKEQEAGERLRREKVGRGWRAERVLTGFHSDFLRSVNPSRHFRRLRKDLPSPDPLTWELHSSQTCNLEGGFWWWGGRQTRDRRMTSDLRELSA